MKHYARSRAWCEWDDFDQWQARARQDLAAPSTVSLAPFHLLSLPGITAAEQRRCAEGWMAARLLASTDDRALLAAEFAAMPQGRRGGRLRLGYLSCDFHQHATALLMVEMLEAHDHARVELFAYSYGADDGHGMRSRLARCFDHFTDITALPDIAAARAIHADGIDILIDLKGYTAGTRSALLTYRPAPVQVNFLGYPGSLGGSFCDYIIGDGFVTPAGSAADYSEAIASMPHSYQPHGRGAAIAAAPTRTSVGLPESGLVFCCFNQAYKFTPGMFDIWCALLDGHPDSVMWLLADRHAEGNLRGEAMKRGVLPHRLVFAPDLPQPEHLARLQLADLALDTSPCNAHTTASDALWAGVPLITCAGETFASRVAGSLLNAVGLPELVTGSLAEYARLAATLAGKPALLSGLRSKLARLRGAAPLFDVAGYALGLESLYFKMWWRQQAGLPPGAIEATGRDSLT